MSSWTFRTLLGCAALLLIYISHRLPWLPTTVLTWHSRTMVFDTITVIHLPTRSDRLLRMQALANAHNLNLTYHQATSASSNTVSGIMDHVRVEREKEGWCLRKTGCKDVRTVLQNQSAARKLYSSRVDEARQTGWEEESVLNIDAYLPDGLLYGKRLDAETWPDGTVAQRSGPIPVLRETTTSDVLRAQRRSDFISYDRYNRRQAYNASLQVRSLPLAPAEVACWHSHTEAMRKFVQSGGKTLLLLEDDVDFEWDIASKIRKAWSVLPADYDSVFVGHCWSHEDYFEPIHSSVPFLRPSHSPKCNHAYALSRKGAIRVLKHLRSPPFAYSMPLDRALIHLIATKRIKSYSFYPSPIVQAADVSSDIQPDDRKHWDDNLVDSSLSRVGMMAGGLSPAEKL